MLYGVETQPTKLILPTPPVLDTRIVSVHSAQSATLAKGKALLRTATVPIAQAVAVAHGKVNRLTIASTVAQGLSLTTSHITPVFVLAANNTGALGVNQSVRQLVSPLTGGGSLVRVKFIQGSGTSLTVSHASIGVQTTTYNTAATPVELLFNGASGFSGFSGGQPILSDWASLSFTSSNNLVVIIDVSVAGNEQYSSLTSTCIFYYFMGTSSYNQATPGGSWSVQTNTSMVLQIDARP